MRFQFTWASSAIPTHSPSGGGTEKYSPDLRIQSTAVCLLEEVGSAPIEDERESGRGQGRPAVGKLGSTDHRFRFPWEEKDPPGFFVISLRMTRIDVLMGI